MNKNFLDKEKILKDFSKKRTKNFELKIILSMKVITITCLMNVWLMPQMKSFQMKENIKKL
jgi:hypothetical protein